MKRFFVSLVGYITLLLDVAFLFYTLHDAIAYSAFHSQGIILIMAVALILGLMSYLCFSHLNPDMKGMLVRMFWTGILLYWTIIVAGNTVFNDMPHLYGEDLISFKFFSTIRIWLKNGLYTPFFSHLIVMFPYGFCLPFIVRRQLKNVAKFQLLLTLCLAFALLWTLVLCKPIGIDNVLLWIFGGVMGYILQARVMVCAKRRYKTFKE